MTTEPTKQRAFIYTPAQLAKVKRLAMKLGTSQSQIVRTLLDTGIKNFSETAYAQKNPTPVRAATKKKTVKKVATKAKVKKTKAKK